MRRKMVWIVFAVVIVMAAAGAFFLESAAKKEAGTVPAYRTISPQEAKRRIDSGEKIVILDVRTPEEYAEGRIPGAVLLPLEPVDKVTTDAETIISDRKTVVFVYCRSGRRSALAAKILIGKGYQNVYDLGGINAWPYDRET